MIDIASFIQSIIVGSFLVVGFFLRDFHKEQKSAKLMIEQNRIEIEKIKMEVEVWKTQVTGSINLITKELELKHEHLIAAIAELKVLIEKVEQTIKDKNNG